MARLLSERDHTTLQQIVRRELREQRQRIVERPPIYHYLGVANADITTRTSGLIDICKGVPPTFTHGNQLPDLTSGSDGVQWRWSTGERFRWTTGTGDAPDQITAWNLSGCTITEDTEVLCERVIARESGGFWTCKPFHCGPEEALALKWINGVADDDINYLDEDKTITVLYGDETVSSQHVVHYILHNGGTIESGKAVTAKWWPSEEAYVIHLADC